MASTAVYPYQGTCSVVYVHEPGVGTVMYSSVCDTFSQLNKLHFYSEIYSLCRIVFWYNKINTVIYATVKISTRFWGSMIPDHL